jgi:hypothetical protein
MKGWHTLFILFTGVTPHDDKINSKSDVPLIAASSLGDLFNIYKYQIGPSLNVFGDGIILLLSLFWTSSIVFFKKSWAAVAQAVQCLTTGWTIWVRSKTGAEDFSSSPLRPDRLRGGVTLTTHPHLVPRLNMSRSYTSSPPMCLHGIYRVQLYFT